MGYEWWSNWAGISHHVFNPTGVGVGLIGMWKAFEELEQFGGSSRANARA